jgi:hypothetical protein
MTDHHDFADHTFGDDHHDPVPFEQPDLDLPHDLHHDDLHHDDDASWPVEHEFETPPEHPEAVLDTPPHETDMTEMPDLSETAVDVFPPTVDVGDLPEPVDGFPWIDSGSLGLAEIAAAVHEAGPVAPHELAEYAAADLPPGVDPWAALAESDDPATAALAKFWQPEN